MAPEIVPTRARIPITGVRLTGGSFKRVYENNITYLKSLFCDESFTSTGSGIRPDCPNPGVPYRGHFEDNIKGQTAGLYLMGAANSLRWQEEWRAVRHDE